MLHLAPDYIAGTHGSLRMEFEPDRSDSLADPGVAIFRLADTRGMTWARGDRTTIGRLWAADERARRPRKIGATA